jgi:hypothetical protein
LIFAASSLGLRVRAESSMPMLHWLHFDGALLVAQLQQPVTA